MTIMTEYVDDELPLPPFAELFGEGPAPIRRKSKKIRDNPLADETSGRWTPEEHRLFLEGIMLYGKDWKKMQPLIKSRSLVQIRTHAQKVFKKIGLKKALMGHAARRGKAGDGGDASGAAGAAASMGQGMDFDGDDTMVGAEELQLLQQMSQQMIQEEEEEQQRRQRQQQQQHQQQPQQQHQQQQQPLSLSLSQSLPLPPPQQQHQQQQPPLQQYSQGSSGEYVQQQHLHHALQLDTAAQRHTQGGGVGGGGGGGAGAGAGSLLPEHAFNQQQMQQLSYGHGAYDYGGAGDYALQGQAYGPGNQHLQLQQTQNQGVGQLGAQLQQQQHHQQQPHQHHYNGDHRGPE